MAVSCTYRIIPSSGSGIAFLRFPTFLRSTERAMIWSSHQLLAVISSELLKHVWGGVNRTPHVLQCSSCFCRSVLVAERGTSSCWNFESEVYYGQTLFYRASRERRTVNRGTVNRGTVDGGTVNRGTVDGGLTVLPLARHIRVSFYGSVRLVWCDGK